jgi:hypothetical protein
MLTAIEPGVDPEDGVTCSQLTPESVLAAAVKVAFPLGLATWIS